VLDIDVKGYFDSIDWDLMLKAVRCHTNCPWVRRTSRVPRSGWFNWPLYLLLLQKKNDALIAAKAVLARYGGVCGMTLHRWVRDPDLNFPSSLRFATLAHIRYVYPSLDPSTLQYAMRDRLPPLGWSEIEG
jgi:hypothetical protein